MKLLSSLLRRLSQAFKTNPVSAVLVGLSGIILVILLSAFVSVMFCETCKGWVGERLGLYTKNPILKFLGIGMGGVLLALQALMSYRRAKALEDTADAQAEAAKAQAKATEEQAKANQTIEQGQRQERLKNAIEHLGHESDSVRLGGAYELFHLAEDTEELRQTVLDILCAHIRRTTGEDEYQEKHKSKPSEEVQSLLTLLFMQKHAVFKGLHINLQGSWLNGADLRFARLEKANLTSVHLQGAVLREARMQGAVLREAQMQEAVLFMAQMQGADLFMARMQGADLKRARMQGADLFMARMQGADLRGARMQGADLREAQMQEAVLFMARMQGADLFMAQMQGADLRRAQMQGADLFMARMQGAVLREARMQGADLREAQMQGADLFMARMQGADLFMARMQGADLRRARMQGAVLREAQMQGAVLREAQMQGATCSLDVLLSSSWEDRIRKSIDDETNLSEVIFGGGLSREDVDSLVQGLPAEKAKELRERLTLHVGEPESHELPQGSGAITGTYTAEKAKQWIAEYNKAMSEVPEVDAN